MVVSWIGLIPQFSLQAICLRSPVLPLSDPQAICLSFSPSSNHRPPACSLVPPNTCPPPDLPSPLGRLGYFVSNCFEHLTDLVWERLEIFLGGIYFEIACVGCLYHVLFPVCPDS